ncbi:hypothetical protein N7461_006591 [Penicillium sp. DV-2018c]|nr:hypothetical protein N7461_006591 [Penicillium sp. DV-2018c]
MSSVNPVRHAELLDNLPSVTEVPDGLYARRIPVLRLDVADASNLGGKDRSREGHAPNVFWQEAAELVATLCTAPPRGLPNSR